MSSLHLGVVALVRGGWCCLAERGSKAHGSKYPPRNLAESEIYWRGAPDTFDKAALLKHLGAIKEFLETSGGEESRIFPWPEFDHAIGDPRGGFVEIFRGRPVVIEGLYLLYWEEVAAKLDLAVYMESDLEQCIARLKVRNQCIPGYTKEEILKRCDEVDRGNARKVIESAGNYGKTGEELVVVRGFGSM